MTARSITLARLHRLLDAWAARADLVVPTLDDAGEAAFSSWLPDRRCDLDFRNSVVPPKSALLPLRELLLRERAGERIEVPPPQRPAVLFGMRPCDAAAVEYLDRVLLRGPDPDPRYARRRWLTTLVSLACRRPVSTCFCSSVGGGPGGIHAADVLAHVVDGELLLVPHTDKGRRLLDVAADLLGLARPAALGEAHAAVRTAEDRLWPLRRRELSEAEAFESDLWPGLGRVCLGCRVCSLLCPTVEATEIHDERAGDEGHRLRSWAEPRATTGAPRDGDCADPRARRWRQRVLHRFRWAVDLHRRPACVGCGRCVRRCPAGLDLRAVLRQLAGDA